MAVPELLRPQYLTPPLTACARRLKPAEKLVKDRLIKREMACESHMIEAMVRGSYVYKKIWCAPVGEELYSVTENILVEVQQQRTSVK